MASSISQHRTPRLAAAALALVTNAAAPPATIEVNPDRPVSATIGGRTLRLLPMANGGRIILNPDAAAAIGLKKGLFAAEGRIGSVRLPGSTDVVAVAVDGSVTRQRVLWFDAPIAPGEDGAIGPAHLPAAIVVFRLRPPGPGERRFVLPMVAEGGFDRLATTIAVDGQTVRVTFDLTRDAAMATAAAGAAFARAFGGALQGPAYREPIRLGVVRPARRLLLAHPAPIGPLAIAEMVTRIADDGDARAIPDADADPDEILVTGKTKRAKPAYTIVIGRAALRDCSSLAFDKPARQIVLTCRR